MTTSWRVALLSAPFTTLSYCQPEHPGELQAGQRVVVPLGKSIRLGILLERETAESDRELKPVIWPTEPFPLLDPLRMRMASEMAIRQMKETGRILASFLPAGLRSLRVFFKIDHPNFPSRMRLGQLASLDREDRAWLQVLWEENRMRVQHAPAREDPVVSLNVDPPWPLRPGATRQRQILDLLWESGSMPKSRLVNKLGTSPGQILRTLQSRKLISLDHSMQEAEQGHHPPDQPCANMVLSLEQEAALEELQKALDGNTGGVRLVHGVTGSGKTLLYLRLAHRCLSLGRSVLLLCPEVALAAQVARAVREELPAADCHLYHGYQSQGQREQTYLKLLNKKGPAIVVGTRSALFLPVTDPGLIIMDEEHDTSFKQDEQMVYQAKELAYFLSRENRALMVMGSATPDVKTSYAADQGHIPRIFLRERVKNRPLPAIEVVDLLQHPPREGPFSPECREALDKALQAGDQAIILQNRRGYAPLVYCPDCGQVARCHLCEVGLTYHKSVEKLLCHYCGLSVSCPQPCRNCGGTKYVPLGEGTEQIEEYLSKEFSGAGIIRLDRDSVRRKGKMEELLDRFSRKESSILVGTQMISKGHHFPGVTVVIVVDGDLGLNLPDYRATERTFQLLVQVAGRAGRGDKPGSVFIQTRNPGHYCWKYVRESDYQGFYATELERRRKLRYPPFVKLGLVRMSYPVQWERGPAVIRDVSRALNTAGKELQVRVLGPAPSPLNQLRGRIRHQCLLKCDRWENIRGLYAKAQAMLPPRTPFRMHLDLDPVAML